jgi:hypothetical protein
MSGLRFQENSHVGIYPCRKGGVMETFMADFIVVSYSVDVAVAFLNHFLTVGRHGVNVCRTNITIKQFPLPPLFY